MNNPSLILSTLTPGESYKIIHLTELFCYTLPVKQTRDRDKFINFINSYGHFEKVEHSHLIKYSGPVDNIPDTLTLPEIKIRHKTEPKPEKKTRLMLSKAIKAGIIDTTEEGQYYTYNVLVNKLLGISSIEDITVSNHKNLYPAELEYLFEDFDKRLKDKASKIMSTYVLRLNSKTFKCEYSYLVKNKKTKFIRLCSDKEYGYIESAIREWQRTHGRMCTLTKDYLSFINSYLKYSSYKGRCFTFKDMGSKIIDRSIYTPEIIHKLIYSAIGSEIEGYYNFVKDIKVKEDGLKLLKLWSDSFVQIA